MQPIDTFHKAKLRPKHIAPLVGVSRVTASLWLNRHGSPHVLLQSKVKELADLIESALAEGKLPIPERVSKSEEVKYLEVTLASLKTA